MKSIVRGYDEDSNIICEYIEDNEVSVDYMGDSIGQVDYYIMQAFEVTDIVDVTDEDGSTWCPV